MFKGGGEKNSTIVVPKKKKITNEEKYELHKKAKEFLSGIGDLKEGKSSSHFLFSSPSSTTSKLIFICERSRVTHLLLLSG